ncbi:hypothetical protein ACSBOB_00945 [Mesorhizobium sp. ASY16-5R]|uniref:hypothetical protein n=1 Tax=Mesorhizobium sp. ASY16-5R TaxID=3445772 RepID=UPI003FA03CDB
MAILVKRGGSTRSGWTGTGAASVMNGPAGVCISFQLSSAGGGATDVQCVIEPESYAEIAYYMMVRNPVAATRAFAKAFMERDSGEKIKDAKPLW